MANERAVQIKQKAISIHDLLTQNADKIKLTLPPSITPNQMITTVMNAIRRTPKIAECTKESVFNAVITAAQLGILPDDVLGYAYIIPYGTEATLMPGYKGYIHLALLTGKVKRIWARVVYDKEPFEIKEGTDPGLIHTPLPPAERGENFGAYCIVQFEDDSKQFTFMYEKEIQHCRKSSKSGNVWANHPDEMRKKTTIRRAMKTLDLSPAVNMAVAIDESYETEKVITGSMNESIQDWEPEVEEPNGKPKVDQPQEVSEAEVKEQPKASPEDEKKYSEILDMTIAMEWSDEKIKIIETMIKAEGMDTAHKVVTGDFKKWQAKQSSAT